MISANIYPPLSRQRLTPVQFFKSGNRLIFWILLALIFQICTGCSVVKIVDILGSDAQILRKGEKQFALGNYQQAAVLFKKAQAGKVGSQSKNAALYSLACTKIALARNDREFMEAVKLLDKWQKSFAGGLYIENPSLMITALEKRLNIIQKKKDANHNQALKNRKVINSQKEKISEMKNILQTLQHQITELEAIDQQLQEKKKPL